MKSSSSCCGGIPQKKKIFDDKNLPKNPHVPSGGVEVIYLGAGDMKLSGKESGLTYFVSDHRRRFTADSNDLPGILKIKDFILKP